MLSNKFSPVVASSVLSQSILILDQISFFISCHFLSNLPLSKQARHKVNPWFIEWSVIHFCCAWFNGCVWLSQCRQQTQHVFLTQLDWYGNSRSFFMSGKTIPIGKKLWIRLYTEKLIEKDENISKYKWLQQDSNPQPQLVRLAKLLSVRLRSKWLWIWIPLQSLKLQISRLFWVRSFLTFRNRV